MKSRSSNSARGGRGQARAAVKPSNKTMLIKPSQDRDLVDRCLAGETAAWSELYRTCHPKLLAAIRLLLGSAGQDSSLIDEIAARVWYALVKDSGQLLARFDDARNCRLTTFVSSIAKREIKQLLRSEKRRLSRERKASRSEVENQPPLTALSADFQEQFLDKLTRSERTYFDSVLVPSSSPDEEAAYSADNRWQLQHRVRKKLEAFLTDVD